MFYKYKKTRNGNPDSRLKLKKVKFPYNRILEMTYKWCVSSNLRPLILS